METRLADCVYALHASREEQGLCPHVKNPAFNAGLVFLEKVMKKLITVGLQQDVHEALLRSVCWQDLRKNRISALSAAVSRRRQEHR